MIKERKSGVPAPSSPDGVDREAAKDEQSLDRSETNNARPACFKSTIQEILFVLTATMAIAMGALLAGSVTVTSSFIGRDLNMTTAEITWITSACSLSNGAFLLFFGKVADLFGRKTLFIGSLFLFAVFALAAGFARSAIALDVLNGVMGLVSASAIPAAVGILGVCYEKPSKRKNYAFACFSAGNPLGFVFGTIFGGLATYLLGWRSSFWLIAIIFLAFTIIGIWTVPRDFTDKEPLNWQTIKRFDIVGTVCIIFGIGMFSAALSLGDSAAQGWRTGYVLALLITGVLLMIAFVLWDLWFRYPLVPMGIWKDRNFTLALSILMMGYMAFIPASFFIALYFQNIWHQSALLVAVRLLPMAAMGMLVNIFAGLVLHRISNKLLMYIAASAYTIAFLLLALNRRTSSYWSFCFPAFCIMVIGADIEFNVANMYVMSSMPSSQQSIAGGIFQTVAKLCTTLGFGIATAVFNSVSQNPSLSTAYWDPETQPYTATFWFSTACSLFSLCLVPFLTIGTQGGKEKKEETNETLHEHTEQEAGEIPDHEKSAAEAMVKQALPVEG